MAQVYHNVRTHLYLNNEKQSTINTTNGARQGCNGSTVLSLLITCEIILRLEDEQVGLKNYKFKIYIFYYADDGLLLSTTIDEAKYSISLIQNIAIQSGIKNKKQTKSTRLIYNQEDRTEAIAGIRTCNEIKYLGITIENKDCSKEHKKERTNKANQPSNMARSHRKELQQVVSWKGVGLATTLCGAEILDYTKKELHKLQRIENKVYRCILQFPTCTPSCVLRSDIGATSTVARDAKIKIMFTKTILKDNRNELMK